MSGDEVAAQVETLVKSAYAMPRGSRARLAVLEEAVRCADMHQREDLGWWARRAVVDTCYYLGAFERIAADLAWCLARADRDPEAFDDEEVLWQCKWPAEHLVSFASVGRAQLDALHEDITRRFERHGCSIRPIMFYRAKAAARMGDGEQVVRGWLERAERLERDHKSDCLACETSQRVEALLGIGALEEALVAGEPILRGEQRCAEVPHIPFAALLWPLRLAGQHELAARLHREGVALVEGREAFVAEIGAHMEHMALEGDVEGAGRLLERHARHAMEALMGWRRLWFWLGAEALCMRVSAASMPWRLPDELPAARGAQGVEVESLRRWCAGQVDVLVAQYAARDGHDGVARQIAARRAAYRRG